jgi:hypothetical protein
MNLKFVFILVLLHFSASGQHMFRDRLRLVNEQYKLQQVEIEMEIEVMDMQDKSVLYNQRMMLLRDHQNYYYQLGPVTMVMNDSLMILIEGSTKRIIVSKRSEVPKEMFSGTLMLNLDSIMNFYENPILISKSATQEHYRVKQKMGSVQHIEVAFNLTRQSLDWVSYQANNQQLTTIRFNKFAKPTSFNEQFFKDETYFHKTSSGLVAAAGFRGYQVSILDQQ